MNSNTHKQNNYIFNIIVTIKKHKQNAYKTFIRKSQWEHKINPFTLSEARHHLNLVSATLTRCRAKVLHSPMWLNWQTVTQLFLTNQSNSDIFHASEHIERQQVEIDKTYSDKKIVL